MAETFNEDAERERKIAEEGVMSVESFLKKRPTRTEDVKVLKIKEKIESEKKKAEERKSGTLKYTRWITVFDARFGARRSMEVEVDEGSNANFLTKGMANDRGFELQSLGPEPFRGETVNGDVVCEEYVELTLVGKEHQPIVAKFYILQPNQPPNEPRITKPLVGRRLVQDCGDLLLTEDPREPILSTKMGKADAYMQEQSKQQAAKVQAYQANASQSRDAARKNQDGKDPNQHNGGGSSHSKDAQGK